MHVRPYKNYKIINEDILHKVGVVLIESKMCHTKFRWLGHVKRRPIKVHVRRMDAIYQLSSKRGKDKLRKNWWETLRYDISYKSLTKNKALHKNDQ